MVGEMSAPLRGVVTFQVTETLVKVPLLRWMVKVAVDDGRELLFLGSSGVCVCVQGERSQLFTHFIL